MASAIAARLASPHALLRQQTVSELARAATAAVEQHQRASLEDQYRVLQTLLRSPPHPSTPRSLSSCYALVTVALARHGSSKDQTVQQSIKHVLDCYRGWADRGAVVAILAGLFRRALQHGHTVALDSQHPFVVVVLAYPELWPDVLEELPGLFEASDVVDKDRLGMYQLLEPLFRYAILCPNVDTKRSFTAGGDGAGVHQLDHPSPAVAVLQFTFRLAAETPDQGILANSLLEFVSLTPRSALAIEPNTDKVILLNELVRGTLQLPHLLERGHHPGSWAEQLLTVVLAHLCNADEQVYAHGSVYNQLLHYAGRLTELLLLHDERQPQSSVAMPSAVYPLLCYVVLGAAMLPDGDNSNSTVERLIRGMHACVRHLPSVMQQMGIVPLLSVQMSGNAATAQTAALCLSSISLTRNDTTSNGTYRLLQHLPLARHIHGTAAHLLSTAGAWVDDGCIPSFENSFDVLFVAPLLLDQQRHQIVLQHLLGEATSTASNCVKSFMAQHAYTLLPLLFFLTNVYLTESTDGSNKLPDLLVILRHFPSLLLSRQDPFVAAKLVSLFNHWTGISATSPLFTLALSMMARLYKVYPRSYTYLRTALYAWAKRVKPLYVAAHNDAESGERHDLVEAEVAVANCIRDLFGITPSGQDPSSAVSGREEDLLPLVYNLLQLDRLHPSSMAMLLDCVVACVERQIAVASAVWDVLLASVAQRCYKLLRQCSDEGTAPAQGLVMICERLFPFFDQVALQCDDASPLSESIVFDFIFPLLPFAAPEVAASADELTTDPTLSLTTFKLPAQIRCGSDILHALALTSLTRFGNLESFALQRVLPSPKSLVALAKQQINSEQPSMALAWRNVLAWAVRSEVEHMPRSLFSGRATIATTRPPREADRGSKHIAEAAQLTQDAAADLRRAASSGTAPTAIRSTLDGVVSMVSFTVRDAPPAELHQTIAAIAAVPFTEHLYSRLQVVPFLVQSFEGAFSTRLPSAMSMAAGDEAAVNSLVLSVHPDTESLVSILIDLLGRFQQATTPSAKAQSCCLLVACVLALYRCRLPHARLFGEVAQSVVSRRYLPDGDQIKLPVLDWGKLLEHSDSRTAELVQLAQVHRDGADIQNDEIQCFVFLSLAALVKVTADDGYVGSLVAHILQAYSSPSSDWAGFAAAMSMATVYKARVTSRSNAPPYLDVIRSTLLAAGKDRPTKTMSKTQLGAFLCLGMLIDHLPAAACDAPPASASADVGAFLIAAADLGVNQQRSSEDVVRLATALQSSLSADDADAAEQPSRCYTVTAFCQALTRLQLRPDVPPEVKRMHQVQLREQFKVLIKSTTMTSARIVSLFAVAALLGCDPLEPGSSAAVHATSAVLLSEGGVSQLRAMLPPLLELSGIRGKASQPRVLRLVLAMLGWLVVNVREAIQQDAESSGEAPVRANRRTTTAGEDQKEPETYSRLGVETSYLRNLFDHVRTLRSDQDLLCHAMEALTQVGHPLPLVDFYPLLERLAASGAHGATVAFQFASAHAQSSFSCLDYLLDLALSDAMSKRTLELVISEQGVGTLLSSAGLCLLSETEAVAKQRGRKGEIVTLAEDKALDVVTHLLARLFGRHSEHDEGHQVALLETLSNHMPNHAPVSSTSLHGQLVEHMVRFHAQHNDMSPRVTWLFVRCCIFSMILFDTLPSTPVGTLEHAHLLLSLSALVELTLQRQQADPTLAARRGDASLEQVLSRAIHHALHHHIGSQQIHATLLAALSKLINQTHVPTQQASVMSAAELQKRQSTLRHHYILQWLVRLMDTFILLATQRGGGDMWQHVQLGVHMYLNGVLDIAHASQWSADQLHVSLLALANDNNSSSTRLADRRLASRLTGCLSAPDSTSALQNQILKRMLAVLRGLEKSSPDHAPVFRQMLQHVFAPLRYLQTSVEEWMVVFEVK
ncbi:hypothetical protein RI367_001984 [Sorochytrium milnesiophthora]